jgi:two-component system response regulator AtoC
MGGCGQYTVLIKMKDNYKILIADDEVGIRELLKDMLSSKFDVETVDRGDTILEILASREFDILILDLQLPGMSGHDVLRKINESRIKIIVVIITASNDIDTAITSMKLGVYDYIVKPFDIDKLVVVLKNIVERLDLENEVNSLREQVGETYRFTSIIGKSAEMHRIYYTLEKVIDTNSTILIIGDSGTGKEVIAKAIHYNSNRKQYPFRSLDCSTIPQDLLGSELLGHEKGSFTGAVSRKIGKFELADRGSLFLDEISNISIEMQAKLLRVLQEMEFERIGGTQIIKVNTRIIAASNRDLRELVKENRFREDLYYRLNVVPIYLPALKDRKEDIPLFIDHFLGKYNREYSREFKYRHDGQAFSC